MNRRGSKRFAWHGLPMVGTAYQWHECSELAYNNYLLLVSENDVLVGTARLGRCLARGAARETRRELLRPALPMIKGLTTEARICWPGAWIARALKWQTSIRPVPRESLEVAPERSDSSSRRTIVALQPRTRGSGPVHGMARRSCSTQLDFSRCHLDQFLGAPQQEGRAASWRERIGGRGGSKKSAATVKASDPASG